MISFLSGRSIVFGILVIVGCASSPNVGMAQDGSAPNRLFLEVLGNGLVYSFNYERDLSGPVTFRIGAGGLPFESVEYALVFGMLGVRKESGVHSLRAGVGAGILRNIDVWITDSSDETHFYGTGAIGYQYQPHPAGFFVRASLTPGFTEDEFFPWGGLGIGWAF